MAWEATAGNWRRRRAAALGFGGLLVVRFAAGAAEAVGEKPLETRICPLIEMKNSRKTLTGKSRRGCDRGFFSV